MKSNCAVVILAGGKSERMNFPKLFLKYSEKTFLEKIVDEYLQAGFTRINVVINSVLMEGAWGELLSNLPREVKLIPNFNSDAGRFNSVKLGLEDIGDCHFCFIQNIDNPFVDRVLIEELWNSRNSEGYSFPVYNEKRGHPVLISDNVMKHIEKTESIQTNFREILSNFSACPVNVNNEGILVNINTPLDYTRHFGIKQYELCVR